MMDQLSRPLGTAGFDQPVLQTGLKICRTAVAQFFFSHPCDRGWSKPAVHRDDDEGGAKGQK